MSFNKEISKDSVKLNKCLDTYYLYKNRELNKHQFLDSINEIVENKLQSYETAYRYLTFFDRYVDGLARNDIDYKIKKKQLAQQQSQLNRKIKDLVAEKNIVDKIEQLFNEKHTKIKITTTKSNKINPNAGNVYMSDIHYINYKSDELTQAFKSIKNSVKNFDVIENLYVLGDFVENDHHGEGVYENRDDVMEQIMDMTYLLIENLTELSKHVTIENIVLFEGNHDEIRQQNYKGKHNTSAVTIAKVILNNTFANINVTSHKKLRDNVNNRLILHGDSSQFSNAKAIEEYAKQHQTFVIHGHFHNYLSNECRLSLPAICGTNEYAKKIGKYSKRGYVIEVDGFFKVVYF